MENSELVKTENIPTKLLSSETNVADGQSNSTDTVEKQAVLNEDHIQINGVPNGAVLNEITIGANDTEKPKEDNANLCGKVEENGIMDSTTNHSEQPLTIEQNKTEQNQNEGLNGVGKENIPEEKVVPAIETLSAEVAVNKTVEIKEIVECKDLVQEPLVTQLNKISNLENASGENASPSVEKMDHETKPVTNHAEETETIKENGCIDIPNGFSDNHTMEQQIIDESSAGDELNSDDATDDNTMKQETIGDGEISGGDELNSDDAINSVIKNLIEALQTTTNTEILSQVTEIIPPEGYISEMDWKKKETALLVKIARMEEDERIKQEAMQIKLKMKCDENEILKSKLKTLDTELRAVCSKPNAKNKDMVSKIKRQHDDLLTKARGMIFEKTKMIKNQELRIEALTTQVASLKDIVAITKDMLNIRNMECKHLQDRMETMELRLQAEKERQNLVAKKLESGNKLNEELKKEYMKQMDLFKSLKEKYGEKFLSLEKNQKEPTEVTSSAQE